jgi:lysophospholipase L1-like esterase
MNKSRSVAAAVVVACAGLAGACGEQHDTSVHAYPADDASIVYTGRVDFSNPKQPRFAINAASAGARFQGTGATVLLKDEFRYGKYTNYYDAIVDGVLTKTIVPTSASDDYRYPIASGLPYGEHSVEIVRRTEPTVGTGFVAGFEFQGTILPPAARPARRLEIIGDSITAGAGVDAVNNTPACTASADGWGLSVEDAYKAYGRIIADDLNAEVHVIGVSGIGLVRNYSNSSDARTMQDVYDLTFPQLLSSPAWDPSQWIPDALVMGLGTNDYGPGDPNDTTQPYPHPAMDNAAFAAAYVGFIRRLQGYYPGVQIFVVSSPILGEPQATELRSALARVEAMAADPKVKAINVTKLAGAGCTSHPDAAQHLYTAMELEPAVKAAMGW